MMKNDTFESLVPGPKCSGPKSVGPKLFPGRSISGPKYFRAEVFSGPKCSLGRSCFWAKVVSGPKLFRAEVFPGRSECRAKAVSGPNWVWAYMSSWCKACIKNITFERILSFMSCFKCAFKCFFLANLVAQILHLKSFFPSWTDATCLLIYPFCVKMHHKYYNWKAFSS